MGNVAHESQFPLVDDIASRADSAVRAEEEAQASAVAAARARRFWTTLEAHIKGNRPVAAFLESERASSSGELSADDAAFLQRVESVLRHKVDLVLERAELTLPDALASEGMSLDATARYPNISMESGFITVSVQEAKLIALVSSRGGVSRKEPLDPVGVARAAADVRDRIFRRKSSHVSPAKLAQAYRALTRARSPGESAGVPIDAIRVQLSPKGKPIPVDEFNVDLAALIRTASETGTPTITLSNTRDTRGGILLHGLEEAGYVGYLRIESES